MKGIVGDTPNDLAYLGPEKGIVNAEQLLRKGLISQGQYSSLITGASEWVSSRTVDKTPLELWLAGT